MRGLSYITRQGYEFQSSPGKDPGRIFAKPGTHESGSHRQDGLLIAAGARVHHLGRIQARISLVDLAPTILALLDCPVPEEMDGKPRQDLFELEKITWSKSSMPGRPELPGSPGANRNVLSESEEQEMIERLKSLGYLE
jgi:arylsulfatase A-like enzyme